MPSVVDHVAEEVQVVDTEGMALGVTFLEGTAAPRKPALRSCKRRVRSSCEPDPITPDPLTLPLPLPVPDCTREAGRSWSCIRCSVEAACSGEEAMGCVAQIWRNSVVYTCGKLFRCLPSMDEEWERRGVWFVRFGCAQTVEMVVTASAFSCGLLPAFGKSARMPARAMRL